MNKEERIVTTLKAHKDLLQRLAPIVYGELLDHEDWHELATEICEAAFGKRVRCPQCWSMVLPGFVCWECEEWTAPEVSP